MKDHTIRALVKEVNHLNIQISTLKTELGATTQALGKNTLAVEGITKGFKDLASYTGEWRTDDNRHHKQEEKLDKEKIKNIKELNKIVKELVDFLKKE